MSICCYALINKQNTINWKCMLCVYVSACVCNPLTSMSIKTESNKLMLTIKDLQFIKLFLAVKHLHIDVDGVTCHDKVICNYIGGKKNYKKLQKILYYDTDLCGLISRTCYQVACTHNANITAVKKYCCMLCLPLPGIMCSSHEQVWLLG